MPEFRDFTPQRRQNRDVCTHYRSYQKTLREDFKKRCGYCNDIDKQRIRSYTIDHFVPQNPKDFTHNIASNDYYNLVYACHYCNSAKSNKWPTLDANVPNDGIVGFIEPTEIEYAQIFSRTSSGKIVPKEPSALADYIIEHLELWYPIHERMWKLEKVLGLHHEIQDRLRKTTNAALQQILKEAHYEILIEIVEIQSSVFVEND